MQEPIIGQERPGGATATIGGAALLGMAGTAATLLFSIARSKTTALVLGPEGVGITAEILQLVTLAATPVAIFSGPALMSRLAPARAAGDDAAIAGLYSCAFTLSGLVASAAGFVAVVAGVFLFHARMGSATWPLTMLAAVGSVGGALAAVPAQVLTVEARLRSLTVIGIVCAALQTLLVVAGTIPFGLLGQFAALAVVPFANLAMTFGALARELPTFRWRPRWTLSRSFVRDALRYGAASLASVIGLQIALASVRGVLELRGGPALNGQFQAAWAIGATYFGFVLGGIGAFAFPRYAAAQDSSALAAEVRSAFRFVMRIAPPAILTMIALRTPIVRLLYSTRFNEAVPLMGLMMAADLGRAVIWVQQGPLLYRGKLRAYLTIELLGVGALALGALILVPRLGLVGVGWAYVASHLLVVPAVAIALRVSTGVTLGVRAILAAMASMVVLLGAALVTDVSLIVRIAMLGVALIWAWRAGLLAAMSRRILVRLSGFGGVSHK
ncbi:MAG: oligosaccharide flippase family protein [Polyangia bacterium]